MSELAQPSRRRCEHHNARAVSSGRPTRQDAVCESAAVPAVRLRRRRGAAAGRASATSRPPPSPPPSSSRTASASRCSSRGPPGSARPSWPRPSRRPPGRVWCACSATRASTRPARSTSGTTPSSCCGSPRARVASRGTRPATTCSPRSSCSRVRCSPRSAAPSPPCCSSTRSTRPTWRSRACCWRCSRDFQVTVPEMGTVTAARRPFALLTSNSTRELSEALKRRCLFLHLDFPDADLERRIVLAPGAGAGRAAGRRAGAHRAGAAGAGAAQGAVGGRDDRLGSHPARARASTPSTTTPCGPRWASSSSTSPTP